MADASEMLQAFARLVAVEVAAILQPAPPQPYTQDNLPPGMSRGTYLDHCRRGDWRNRKLGRLRVTDRADFDAWASARTTRPRLVPPVATETEPYDVEAHLRATSKPARRRSR